MTIIFRIMVLSIMLLYFVGTAASMILASVVVCSIGNEAFFHIFLTATIV